MAEHFECREHLQAIDEERNIARDYQLYVTRDLFYWTIVDRHWGRIGSAGQSARDSFPTVASAPRFVETVRRRRAVAQDLIGVAYLLI